MSDKTSPLASPVPRYQQVGEALAREIREGHHPVGSLLPPEPQLCEQFGVSRHTLREAVRRLCDIGLVVRQQGIGTRVTARNGSARYVASLGSLQELMQYSQRTRIRRLSDRWIQADGKMAALLQCQIGERWLEVETCRYPLDGDVPLVHMRIYVRPDSERVRDELEHSDAWVFGLVEKHGGEAITEARQIVAAVALPAAPARVLGVRPGSPGLLVRRYYLGRQARLLSVSLNLYPAARFEIDTRWRLTAAAQEK